MNLLNIILLSCSVAVTVAQKVSDTRNDIIDPRRNTGGYGLLRPSSQGGYSQGGYNQGGYSQGGYNQGGYNQGGFNRPGYGGYPGYTGGTGGVSPGGYGEGYGGNQGYGQGYGGNQGYGQGYGGSQGFGQGYGGNQGFGQGYGGNQGFGQGYGGRPGYGGSPGYGGGRPGLGPYPGLSNYPGGYGGTGGFNSGGFGGRPNGFGQGLQSQYPAGFRPRPEVDPGFPELSALPSGAPNYYYNELDRRPIATPFNHHTGHYYSGIDDGYKLSDHLRRQLGVESKAGKVYKDDKKS